MLQSDVPKSPQGSNYFKTVTDMWLERCLHRAECLDPQADPTSVPFRLYPIPGMSAIFLAEWASLTPEGFENTTICSTAFRGVDLLHLSKAVKLIGIDLMSPIPDSLLINVQVQIMTNF